ncbi:hypothetical protein MBLNU230_g2667t1 [Neophaeotheca triangularis]
MSCYSFYIFDRHTNCIYSKRFQPPPQNPNNTAAKPHNPATAKKPQLSDSDDAKLIFGTIFSLRRICSQLGGAGDSFLSYRTAEYKLHYFETPTQLKFVMLTSVAVGSMRTVLYQIWASLFVEFVVKSPLVPWEEEAGRLAGKGVGNELFEGGLESFVQGLFGEGR